MYMVDRRGIKAGQPHVADDGDSEIGLGVLEPIAKVHPASPASDVFAPGVRIGSRPGHDDLHHALIVPLAVPFRMELRAGRGGQHKSSGWRRRSWISPLGTTPTVRECGAPCGRCPSNVIPPQRWSAVENRLAWLLGDGLFLKFGRRFKGLVDALGRLLGGNSRFLLIVIQLRPYSCLL